MINISEITLYPEQISAIDPAAKGIYLLIGENDEVLYIGRSKNLQLRLKQHFSGAGNTQEFSRLFRKCAVFFLNDNSLIANLEKFLIIHFKPSLNIQFNNNDPIEND